MKSIVDARRDDDRHATVGIARRRLAAKRPPQTTEMMRQVVCSDRAPATSRQVDGLSIAGKTGTAFKAADNGTYFDENGERIYYASFVGFFPADDPAGRRCSCRSTNRRPERRPLRWHGGGAGVRRVGSRRSSTNSGSCRTPTGRPAASRSDGMIADAMIADVDALARTELETHVSRCVLGHRRASAAVDRTSN